jgi:hypothetical protein
MLRGFRKAYFTRELLPRQILPDHRASDYPRTYTLVLSPVGEAIIERPENFPSWLPRVYGIPFRSTTIDINNLMHDEGVVMGAVIPVSDTRRMR